MACIDKMFATEKQYLELYDWCKKNKPYLLKYLVTKEYYNGYPDKNEKNKIAIFPEKMDMWLLENCSIKWVTDRIKEQYNYD